MKVSQRVIELWPAQDFITMGDNSRTQSELSFLYGTRLLNGEVSRKYLKGL